MHAFIGKIYIFYMIFFFILNQGFSSCKTYFRLYEICYSLMSQNKMVLFILNSFVLNTIEDSGREPVNFCNHGICEQIQE